VDGPGSVEHLRLASPAGRWTVAAAVLGSGAAFLESTVVHVALPAMARDFGLGIEGLQWVLNGYLLTLSALMLLGGSLGDVHRRRRIFILGLLGFAATSVLAALVPTLELLVVVRLLQGGAGALLVPNSLALLEVSFAEEDRGTALGTWAAWSGVSTALGPLLGGWLVDALSWRWVFAAAAPFAVAAAWVAARKVPGVQRAGVQARSVDYLGAALVTLGLAGVVGALIAGPGEGFTHPGVLLAGVGGAALLVAFGAVERRARDPLLPLSLFRSRQFTGANLTTLLIYAALGGLFFLLMLQLQNVLGYSALAAGAALLPVNALMLLLSPMAGRLAQRIGPRWPMTAGALVAAGGMLLLARVQPGATYLGSIFPGLGVFGLGLATLVAPLTAAVLEAAPDEQTGVASGVNNAAARLAGLLATAALPLVAGLGGLEHLRGSALAAGYTRAMWISAGLCALGALVAFLTIRTAAPVRPD
jgi:EmrB/QacA subfamily drug resistance transporter